MERCDRIAGRGRARLICVRAAPGAPWELLSPQEEGPALAGPS
jgi:hypothetical protein